MSTVISNEKLNSQYTVHKMENGMTVFVCPMPDKSGAFALLGTKFGSADGKFIIDGKSVEVPAGTAHFLEHKMFENEDEDTFALFSKVGANANAFTSFDRTVYVFDSSVNVMESLKILIDFVNSPHFTPETVAKEQGIIGEEIKMYQDSAEWVVYMSAIQSLYKEISLKEDIAGSVESIATITPEVLYDCYNAFYRPSNMVLSIAGNVDPDEVIALCESEYAKLPKSRGEVSVPVETEPLEIVSRYTERDMNIFENQFCLAYKETPFTKEDQLMGGVAVRILLRLIAGETSDLYRSLYDEGLVTGTFDLSCLSDLGYLCVSFAAESKNPKLVCDRIRSEIERMKERGIDRERFEEQKRAMIGSVVCDFDSVEAVASSMLDAGFKNRGIYDAVDAVFNVDTDYAEQLLKNMFVESRSALSVVKPR